MREVGGQMVMRGEVQRTSLDGSEDACREGALDIVARRRGGIGRRWEMRRARNGPGTERRWGRWRGGIVAMVARMGSLPWKSKILSCNGWCGNLDSA